MLELAPHLFHKSLFNVLKQRPYYKNYLFHGMLI